MYSFLSSLHVNVIESGNVELQCYNLQYSYMYVFNKHSNSLLLIQKNTETALGLIFAYNFITLIMNRFMVGITQISDGPFVYIPCSSSNSP